MLRPQLDTMPDCAYQAAASNVYRWDQVLHNSYRMVCSASSNLSCSLDDKLTALIVALSCGVLLTVLQDIMSKEPWPGVLTAAQPLWCCR